MDYREIWGTLYVLSAKILGLSELIRFQSADAVYQEKALLGISEFLADIAQDITDIQYSLEPLRTNKNTNRNSGNKNPNSRNNADSQALPKRRTHHNRE